MSDYFHYNEPLSNSDTGQGLIGYFLRVIDATTGAVVPIYADENSTPISSVSGKDNLAQSDADSMVSFYVTPANAYNLDLYAPDGETFLKRYPNVSMASTIGPQGPQGVPGTAGNVDPDLASLKAALTTDVARIYDHAVFKWTTGDYTGQADDTNIIESDNAALTVGAWVRQLAANIQASDGNTVQANLDTIIVTPQKFGADGIGDDTTALQAFLNALGNGVHGRWDGGPYTISAALQLLNKDNFNITGQCTIVMAAGSSDTPTYDGLLVQGCTNFLIEGLTNDGNRANRTPAAGGGCCFRIVNSHRGKFRNCSGLNATTDGWYVRGSSVTDITTYPTDVTFEDCTGLTAGRNGMSLVGAVRPKVIRGSYGYSAGFSPEAGIDSEPNSSDIFGVVDPFFDAVDVSNNNGSGLIITGSGTSVTSGARVRSLTGSNNKGIARYTASVADRWGGALLEISNSTNTTIESFQSGDHPNFSPGSVTGIVEIESVAANVDVANGHFTNVTASSANVSCIHLDTAVGVKIRSMRMDSIACAGVNFAATDSELSDIKVKNSTFTGIAINVTGARNKISNLDINGHASGSYAGYFTGAFHTFRNLKAQDTVATNGAFRFDSSCTNADIDGVYVHATTAVPTGNALRIDAAPDILKNVRATKESAATGSWTTANLIFSATGLFANSVMVGFTPNVIVGSSTYDPPSVAAGASTTANIGVAKASIGDRAVVTPPLDLGGLILTVPAVSVAGRVDFTLFNPTAAAIDLTSGTWKAAIVKS